MPSSGWRWRRKRNTAQGAPKAEYRSRNAGSGRPSGPSCQAGKRTPRLTPSNPGALRDGVSGYSFTRKSEALSDRIRGKHVGPGQDFSRCRCPAGISTVERGARHGWCKFDLNGFRLRQRRSGLRFDVRNPFTMRKRVAPLHVAGSSLRVSVRPVRAAAPAPLAIAARTRRASSAESPRGTSTRPSPRPAVPDARGAATLALRVHERGLRRSYREYRAGWPVRQVRQLTPSKRRSSTHAVDAMVIARNLQPKLSGRAGGPEFRTPDVAAHGGKAAVPSMPHDLLVWHAVPVRRGDEAGAQPVQRHRLQQSSRDPGQRGALEQDLADGIGMKPA